MEKDKPRHVLGEVIGIRYLDPHRNVRTVVGVISAVGSSFIIEVTEPANMKDKKLSIIQNANGVSVLVEMPDDNFQCFEKYD